MRINENTEVSSHPVPLPLFKIQESAFSVLSQPRNLKTLFYHATLLALPAPCSQQLGCNPCLYITPLLFSSASPDFLHSQVARDKSPSLVCLKFTTASVREGLLEPQLEPD